MQLLRRSIYVLFFMSSSLLLNASVEPSVSIRSQKGQSFSLRLKDMNNETHHIKLIDKKGYVFLNEQIEDQNEYVKLFNLKNLPTGNYRLEIESDYKIILQDINVLKQQLTVDFTSKREFYKPTIRYAAPHLDLNMIYFGDGTINLVIRDENNQIAFKENLNKKGSINKRFDTSILSAGNYFVEIETNQYTIEQEFSIKSDNKISNDKRKKTGKNRKATSVGQKHQRNYIDESIKSKIKWQQSQRN